MPSIEDMLPGIYGGRATEKGTPIMRPGSDMDKNAFLKILSAELQNQDPSGNNDSTQYVTQMSQFSTMEQLQNLNTTMTNFAHGSLVGKGATMKVTDENGQPYTGVIRSVTTKAGKTTVSMEVNVDGENQYKPFDVEDIVSIANVPDYSLPALNNVNGNMTFLFATSLIGKEVELTEKDSSDKNYLGTVLGAFKEDGQVKIKLKVKGSDEVISVTIDKLAKVGDLSKDDKPGEGKTDEENKTPEESTKSNANYTKNKSKNI